MATKQDSEAAFSAPAGPAAASSSSTAKSEPSSASTPKDKSDARASPASLPGRDKESFDRIMIERCVNRDQLYRASYIGDQRAVRDLHGRMRKEIADYKLVRGDYRPWFTPGRLYGEGYSGYGNGRTEIGGPSRLLYPGSRPRPGKRTTPQVKFKRKDLKTQAEQHEELVPVRLDVDWDKIKLRDTFTWNLHERLISPELFAHHLVEDMGLRQPAAQPVFEQAANQMHEQLGEFFPFVYSDEDALDPELPYSAFKNDEMRILIKLNITIGQHTLIDQFEWELNNPLNSPEEFAASMATELSLSGEFTTAIAHCIREQAQLFTRSLYIVGHPFDGRPTEDPDIVSAMLPSPLPTVFRPQQQAKEYAPYLYELSEADLERNEVIFQREQRRQKRSVNRRGGPQLPDFKERQRTIRTLVVSSTLPGAAASIEESRLYKRVAGVVGRGKRPGVREGDLSDSDDSDDSSPDSPAASHLAAGTARTRGMRGAASAAQQRMANLGRSETPEATIHHHETRTSRRFGRELTRDATEEPQHLMVTLKVGREKLRRLFRDLKLKQNTPSGSHTPAQSHARAPSAAARTPAQTSMPPPSIPNAHSTPAVAASTPSNVLPYGQTGRVEAPAPTVDGDPPLPEPPAWLSKALEKFQESEHYKDDQFEGYMRYTSIDSNTGAPCPMPEPGEVPPPHVRFYFLPRIRCLDCPGKLYTPGADQSVTNFEIHLKNRSHRENVNLRLKMDSENAAAGAEL